jgi:hypothetical protein
MVPLARVADILGIDPYHFSQIYTVRRPPVPSCPDIWYQYDNQASGLLSRESLALALRQAEDMLVTHLQWTPIPRWFEEEHRITRHHRPEMIAYRNTIGKAKSVSANYGYITEVGKRASTFIATPATVIQDLDGERFQ